MAIVKPFCALRPKPEFAKKVAAPPYDVLSSEEARELVKENPDSFLRVNKSEVDFPPESSSYSDEIYRKGKENLKRLYSDGLMIQDENPCFYLYRLTMNGQSQTGIAALTSVDEYDRGLIKKHEHTRPQKVDDRANHIMTLGAQVGPVFSIFKQNTELKSLFTTITAAESTVDFTSDDSVRHELWVVDSDSDIRELINAFAQLPELYIADGHHRSEAASEVCRRMKEKNEHHTGEELYNYFLNVIFPDDELHILSYNRVVSETNNLSIDDIIAKSADKFEITKSDSAIDPKESHQIGIYTSGQWYNCRILPGSFDNSHPVDSIDSAILTKNLLAPLFGIENLRTDDRIDFVGGIRGVAELKKLIDSNKYKMAFSLSPVTVEQLLAVADAGEVMPPKSTWFEPKLRSGMVVNLLDDLQKG
ncbi:MAG: DUF1015 domain-containing protein [Calditrichaeota bacterium]|nr:MAG: DUF1015 domain-containing protein [Calditrichota bacterium]